MQNTPDLSVHNHCFGALIAQNARVPNGYEPKGRGFESLLAYQKSRYSEKDNGFFFFLFAKSLLSFAVHADG